MQIAVLSDIHGNLPALEAVAADLERLDPDLVFVAGDFQNRGPNPREVTQFVAESGWTLLRGNHEDYVIRQSQNPQPSRLCRLFLQLAPRPVDCRSDKRFCGVNQTAADCHDFDRSGQAFDHHRPRFTKIEQRRFFPNNHGSESQRNDRQRSPWSSLRRAFSPSFCPADQRHTFSERRSSRVSL